MTDTNVPPVLVHDRFNDLCHRVVVARLALSGLREIVGGIYGFDAIGIELDGIKDELDAIGDDLWPEPEPDETTPEAAS